MIRFVSRLVAMVLACNLAVQGAALCQGWLPTAEARMDCCANETDCPMHKGSAGSQRQHAAPAAQSHVAAHQVVSQADADACCASANDQGQRESTACTAGGDLVALAPVGASALSEAIVPVFADTPDTTPRPPGSRSRHVLHAVFLI